MSHADADILTVEDLAELFACDKETVAARLISGDLPGVKVGRSWIVPRQALFERLNEKAREEAAARRSLLASTLEGCQKLKHAAGNSSVNPGGPAPTVVLASIPPQRQGRKRRIPPKLPSLDA